LSISIKPKKIVIPAQAGTHGSNARPADEWVPAFAGMTMLRLVACQPPSSLYCAIPVPRADRVDRFGEAALAAGAVVEQRREVGGDGIDEGVGADADQAEAG